MRLVQIRLAGFKSFVDPTSIHVPGQLVGVVGPNGCGQSNVIDAVRWVLGESRATASRPADAPGNPARLPDIRTELGAQLETLQAQATVATRYKEYHSELQLRQHLLWYARRRDAAAERERHALEMSKVANELEAEHAELRYLESRVETARAAHYRAGDALNAAQAALYAANAEVARLESELRHVEETRQRLESQHTERLAQLASWREQRAQLTQALHLWAARAATARQ